MRESLQGKIGGSSRDDEAGGRGLGRQLAVVKTVLATHQEIRECSDGSFSALSPEGIHLCLVFS